MYKKNILIAGCLLLTAFLFSAGLTAQEVADSLQSDATSISGIFPEEEIQATAPQQGLHQYIKIKFIEGSVVFMSFIAIALVAGLAFCLERIIYLNLSQINSRRFLKEIEEALKNNKQEEAMELARNTRGPIASICYQGLSRIEEDLESIEKSITAYGNVQIGLLEKNFSWISLFIAMAPSLGFLGTVIGMIQSFDNIQMQGDISPTIVAGGMKVALITTVGGLVVAMILQLFYNYILTKEEGIINEMEDASITLLDMIIKYKRTHAIG